MKPTSLFMLVFIISISIQAKTSKTSMQARLKETNMSQLKILKMKYDQTFNAEKGVLYQFPDFKIQYLGVTPMSVEAKREKEAADAEGMDGGASMNTDSQDFEVIGNDVKPFYKISMQMLPYAWDSFEYNKKKFNFEKDDDNSDLFVMRDGPLMRDRNKAK